MKVKFLIPEFPPIWSYIPDLFRIYKNGQFSNRGEILQKFERKLKERYCYDTTPVCVNNATTGLEIAIKALNLKPGSKVLVPSMTFAASILAIKNAGLVPVYCDVSKSDLCMIRPSSFSPKAGEFSAVMPVCAYGNFIDSEIVRFANTYNLKIIIDAAGAIGNVFADNFYDALVFSFHATKMLPVGEGGCVVFANKECEQNARKLIDFGFDSSRECEFIGVNGKMSEITAAIGIQALKRLDNVIFHRTYIRKWYTDIFKELSTKGLARVQAGMGLQLLTVICKDKEFKNLLEYHLNSNGIETRVYYKPCHDNGVLVNEQKIEQLYNTNDLKDRIISLPFYSRLTFAEMDHIQRVIKNWGLYK